MPVKSERRWQIRKLIFVVNLMILGLAFFMDYAGIKADAFQWAANGFQLASAVWFSADYATSPKDDTND